VLVLIGHFAYGVSSITYSPTPARDKFDQDIKVAYDAFSNDINHLVDSLIAQMRDSASPFPGESSESIFSRAPSEFSTGIGDSTNGAFGTLMKRITSAVELVSQSVARISTQLGSYDNIEVVQKQVSDLFAHVNSVITDTNNKAIALVNSSSTKFYADYNTILAFAARVYVRTIIDTYVGKIKRAESNLSTGVDKLIVLYDSYTELPENFYENANSIITELSDKYNADINDANDDYSKSVSSYKFYTTSSTDELGTGNTLIRSEIESSSNRVSDLFASLSDRLKYKFVDKTLDHRAQVNKVIAAVTVDYLDKTWIELGKLETKISNVTKKCLMQIEDSKTLIRDKLKISYVPRYVDGVIYRNARASAYNDVVGSVSTISDSVRSEYEAASSNAINDYNESTGHLHDNIISYVNDVITDLTQQDVDAINSRVESMVSINNSVADRIVSTQHNSLSFYLDNMYKFFTFQFNSYYSAKPLIRFEGSVSKPLMLSSEDVNDFSFDVKDVGLAPWVGWFGIKFTQVLTADDVEAEVEPAVFRYNKRAGYITVYPGIVTNVTISIHPQDIYSMLQLGGGFSSSVIVNTVGG
jgi:hypothetical protein